MRLILKHLKVGLVIILLTTVTAQAEVKVEGAWVRLLPPMTKMTAAYMRLTSDQDDRLLGASSEMASVVEIHQSSMNDGVMSMREVTYLALPENQAVELKPQSYHLMIMGLKAPLTAGDIHKFELEFEQAGKLVISVPVQEH